MQLVSKTWTDSNDPMNNAQMEYDGGDDDIRSRFEKYLYRLLVTVQKREDTIVQTGQNGQKGKNSFFAL